MLCAPHLCALHSTADVRNHLSHTPKPLDVARIFSLQILPKVADTLGMHSEDIICWARVSRMAAFGFTLMMALTILVAR